MSSKSKAKSKKVFGNGTTELPDYAKKALEPEKGGGRRGARSAESLKAKKCGIKWLYYMVCLAILAFLMLYIHNYL